MRVRDVRKDEGVGGVWEGLVQVRAGKAGSFKRKAIAALNEVNVGARELGPLAARYSTWRYKSVLCFKFECTQALLQAHRSPRWLNSSY
jgi:hypothetical protein